LSRPARNLVQKAGKVIGKLTIVNAQLEAQNAQLQHQLKNLGGTSKRKKVALDPNELFASVETIRHSMDEMARAKAIYEAREPAREARKTAIAVQNMTIEEITVEWQLE
jgi:hypothetical protein